MKDQTVKTTHGEWRFEPKKHPLCLCGEELVRIDSVERGMCAKCWSEKPEHQPIDSTKDAPCHKCSKCGCCISESLSDETGDLCLRCYKSVSQSIEASRDVLRATVHPPAESLLSRADKIIHGEKREDYGDAVKSFNTIAARWSILFGIPIRPIQVCQAMIDLKMVRLSHQQKDDTILDIAGYTGLADQVKDLPCPIGEMFKRRGI